MMTILKKLWKCQKEIQKETKKTALTPTPPPSRGRWLFDQLVSFGFALLIVFVIRSSLMEAFKIPSGSMLPGLFIGDHIFVNKFAYGFKIPFSDLLLREPFYIVRREAPQRGDVIVFLYPENEDLYFIKRVIGIPGDTVEVREDRLYINSELIQRSILPADVQNKIFEELKDPHYTADHYHIFSEELEGKNHLILHDQHPRNRYAGPFHVPPKSYFVMGDNRNGSHDSRAWGFVEERAIKGKAFLIWASFQFDLFEGVFGFKPLRTGTWIH